MSPILFFIRHGETDWNLEGRLQGQRDIPLNDTGRKQARRNGLALAAHFAETGRGPKTFRYISSPLGRTRDTMEILRRELGLQHKDYDIDPTIQEITFGDWEGYTRAEVKAKDPDAARRRNKDKYGFVPPNGESYAMLSKRVLDWYAECTVDTVLVSHGGVMRVLRGHLQRISTVDIPMLDVPQDKVLKCNGRELAWL